MGAVPAEVLRFGQTLSLACFRAPAPAVSTQLFHLPPRGLRTRGSKVRQRTLSIWDVLRGRADWPALGRIDELLCGQMPCGDRPAGIAPPAHRRPVARRERVTGTPGPRSRGDVQHVVVPWSCCIRARSAWNTSRGDGPARPAHAPRELGIGASLRAAAIGSIIARMTHRVRCGPPGAGWARSALVSCWAWTSQRWDRCACIACCFSLSPVGSPRDLTGLFRRRIAWEDGAIREPTGAGAVAFLMNRRCSSGEDVGATASSVGKR